MLCKSYEHKHDYKKTKTTEMTKIKKNVIQLPTGNAADMVKGNLHRKKVKKLGIF